LVSDLHDAELGENNSKIIEALKESEPNIIAITGDIIDSNRTNIELSLNFAREAAKIAPCFFVSGNHEARMKGYDELERGLKDVGVIILDNEKLEITRNGDKISLLGIKDVFFSKDRYDVDKSVIVERNLNEIQFDDEEFTLLLAHRPEVFDVYVEKNIDLVLSGHLHGGQFRLPFVGGLYVPNQGFFPEIDAGLYTEGNTNMIISRGIGNSTFPFRFNNRPEVIIVELEVQN
jgi:predicted MPP superfamily phosphohydrolase